MKKKLTALLLCGSLVWSVGLPGALALEGAEQPAEETVQGTEDRTEEALPHSLCRFGTVTQIERDEAGNLVSLTLKSEGLGNCVMLLSERTVWVDSGERLPSDPATLEVGEAVYVYHSPAATLSLPPQSEAYAVVRKVPQDGAAASWHVAEEVTLREDGSWSILTDNGGLYIYAGENTGSTAYDGSEAALSELKPGDAFLAWYDEVLESYPAQTYTGYVMLLPREATVPLEGAQITMELDGKVPNLVGRYECGTAMVPVAAVAQALGYQVTYTPDTQQGVLVTVESDTFAVMLYVDLGLIYGVTKLEGAVGMTGPQSYGMTPYIAAPGTTWAPAGIFQLLGRSVTLEGTNLVIE